MGYGVLIQRKGDKDLVRFLTTWGEEIELRLAPKELKRLGKRLLSFGERGRRSVSARLDKDFTVSAERDRMGAPCLLRFEFVWENPTLLIPSENELNYTGFTEEEIADFGKQLMLYEKNGRALIGDA